MKGELQTTSLPVRGNGQESCKRPRSEKYARPGNGRNSVAGTKTGGKKTNKRKTARLASKHEQLKQSNAELHEEVQMLDWEKEQLQEEVGAADDAAEEKEQEKARAQQKHPPTKAKRKRVRKMGCRSGADAHNQQVKILEKHIADIYTDEVDHAYRAAQLAALLLRSQEGRQALMDSAYVKKHDREVQQAAVDEIQGHFNASGIVAKHSQNLSWNSWGEMRRILGFDFEPPLDETYSTPGDIGEYYRLQLDSGVKMPVLPSKYLVQKQEEKIVREAGGVHHVR